MPGDKKALLAVIGSCIAIFWPGALTFGFPGVMAPVWQEMFHVGRAATGLTIFFMLAAVGAFMFLVGRGQERWGLRRMMAIGVIITALASLIVSQATSIYTVYAWAFVNGMASSFVYVPALTLVQWCYPQKRGLVAGTVSMVFGLAAAIMSPLFAKMLSAFGYEAMNFVIAHSARSLSVKESLHTRSFWLLWITWTLAGAAGVSMTLLATSYGLFLGFPLPSAILILAACALLAAVVGFSFGTLFFCLRSPGGGLLRPGALWCHLRPDLRSLRFCGRASGTHALRLPAGCDGRQLLPGFYVPGHLLPAGGVVHPAGCSAAKGLIIRRSAQQRR